mgnify:CR=1 FL=1
MRNITNHNQQHMFDPWDHLGPKRRKLLDDSWAGIFQKEVLPVLPVEQFAAGFAEDFGRPAQDASAALGVMVLQQIHDLTDEQTLEQFAYNLQWHYALNITSEDDPAKYMCQKTLWNIRQRCIALRLDQQIFQQVTDRLAAVFAVDGTHQRIDSMHIHSNMQRLGRIRLFATTIGKFLRHLQRQDPARYDTVAAEICERYTPSDGKDCFSRVKPSAARQSLQKVSQDAYGLLVQFSAEAAVGQMPSYQLLQRVVEEQCDISESETETTVALKPASEVPSDSLQNPSDPDAGYSGHKGQGYQVQVLETYSPKDTSPADEPPTGGAEAEADDTADEQHQPEEPGAALHLITHVHVEPAHESDAHALMPALESVQQRGLTPDVVLADALYGGYANYVAAREAGVELLAPLMGRPPAQAAPDDEAAKRRLTLVDFALNDEDAVVRCPAGKPPVQTKHTNGRHVAVMDQTACRDCPLRGRCVVEEGKKNAYVRYTTQDVVTARRRVYEETAAFTERYRWRSGVEGSLSGYDRKTGVKRLRVRELANVRCSAVLKATGINIFRATNARKARNKALRQLKDGCMAFFRPVTTAYRAFSAHISKIQGVLFRLKPCWYASPHLHRLLEKQPI